MFLSRKILLVVLLLLPVVIIELADWLHIKFIILPAVIGFAIFFIAEINRRKKIEKILRSYISLVEHNQVVIHNMKDEIISWNKGMEDMYGWKKEEVTGYNIHELLSTQFPVPLKEIHARLLTDDCWTGEIKHTDKNGKLLIISSHWLMIRDLKGLPSAIVETNTNITALKKAEEQLMLLSHLVDQSTDAIYNVDAGGTIKSWNKGAEKLYGFTKQEALGSNADILLQTGVPTSELDLIKKQVLEQGNWTGELKRKTKEGKDVYAYTSASCIKENGQITGYIGVSFGITDQIKLREEINHLANLVEQSNDAILSVLPDGTIVSWNNNATILYGYTAEEAIGQNISIIVPPELSNDERINTGEIIKGKNVHQYETYRIKKDGSQVFISLTLSPLKNTDNIITGICGIARNISERRKAEQKIIESEENLSAIFENASEGFILADVNGIVKAINQRAETSIFKTTKKRLEPGSNLFNHIAESRKNFLEKVFSDVFAGNTVQYDDCYTDACGNNTWLNYTYSPVKENNLIKSLCISSSDITDKKILEQQREFDRNNLNALINNTQDLIWSVDCDYKLITANHAFNEMTKRISGKILRKGSDIFSGILNDVQKERYRKYYERAFSGEAFTETEYTYTSFEHWAENSFYPIYEGDKVVGTACYSHDISEQKKAAEMLQLSFNEKQALAERMTTTLDTLPASIALLNDRGIIIDVNKAWRSFSYENGFPGRYCSIGHNYITMVEGSIREGEETAKKVAAGIRAVIQQKDSEFIHEYACHSTNSKRWFRIVATPLKDKEYEGAVVMHLDISKLKELEEERLQSSMDEQKNITRIMLGAQEKERNELGRELHDNVCQIMAAVKMKLGFCFDTQTISLPVIKDAIAYLDEAITETRNLSHRMLLPRFNESSLTDALQHLTSTYSHEKRIVTLKTNGSEEKKIPVPLKETLYRIAQEQLHNIDKYAKASTVEVYLNLRSNQVVLHVQDNGMGFNPKEKQTGVGLANIKNRTESFNGLTKIISAPGEGCLLMIKIPLAG